MDNRLTRSLRDRMLTGVAGGMAEYFDIDPVIIRLLWVLGAVFTGGLLVLVYFVMAIIMPSPPEDEEEYEDEDEDDDLDEEAAERADEATDGTAAGEADDRGEDAADEEAEPKTDGGATAAAGATSTAGSDAPLAEAPQGRSRREARRASRRHARRRGAARRRGQGAVVIGTILLVIGALALVDQFSWLSFWQFWPLILIGIGGALILGRLR